MKSILRNSAITVLVLVLNSAIFAEGKPTNTPVATASVSGKVLDMNSGETLAGVVVSVEGTDMKVYTDLDGNFTINGIEPGTYNLILSMISYKKSLVENLKLQANDEEIIDIKLDNE